MNVIIIIVAIIITTLILARIFRKRILGWLIRLRSKLQIRSLREAIGEADKNKADTGRKNMVVFNTVSGKYEPLQKRLLKAAANSGKNKNNAAMTDGRKRMKRKKVRIVEHSGVKNIEKKSLYVTN